MELREVLIMFVGVGNFAGMLLNIYGKRSGWVVVALTQFQFGLYLIVTEQWTGVFQFGCFFIALYGVWRWTFKGVHRTGREERVNHDDRVAGR